MGYQPPYCITPAIITLIAEISEKLGALAVLQTGEDKLRLRRINRIRTIQGSLAIEGNTLTEAQITAVLAGKPVIAPPKEVQEVRNALQAYEKLDHWQADQQNDVLNAHQLLMQGLIDDAGHYRQSGVGVMQGDVVIHMAPPANRVAGLMQDLLHWLRHSKEHSLIRSCVFHYEFEFIHPFADGNGRMGRLWQTLILSQWKPIFAHLPVESLVYAHQAEYYLALQESTEQTNSAPFIAFMLQRILEACVSASDQVTDQVSDQVNTLLKVLYKHSVLTADELLKQLGLKHRPTFRKNYLTPALQNNLITMTQPDRPKSPTQKYRLTGKGLSWASKR
ncbi:MAG: Fic family protein [Gammaproteobacteria bacterium]|nr:Fic family protein [Gammaproteobacteria bacterium]